MNKIDLEQEIQRAIELACKRKMQTNSITEKNQLLQKFYDKICHSSAQNIVSNISTTYPYQQLIKAQICEESIDFCNWFQSRIDTKSTNYLDLLNVHQDYCNYHKTTIQYERWKGKFKLYFTHIEIFDIGEKSFICGHFKS